MEFIRETKELNRHKLLSILESSIDAIVYIDTNNKIVFFNRAAEALIGYEREEVLGLDLGCIFPEKFRAKHHAYIDHNRKSGTPNNVVGMNRDLLMDRKNGDKRWVNISLNKLGDGANAEYVAIFRDIDEQRTKNLQLKASEQNLKEISNIAALGSWQYEFKNDKLSLSEETYNLLGLHGGSKINSIDEFYKTIHPDDLKLFRKCFDDPTSVEPCVDLEVRYKQQDNSFRYIQLRVLPIYEDNKLTKLLGINQDINERKQLEIELVENKKRYKELFDSVFEAIIIHDNERIIEVNSAFENMFLYSKKDILDKRILDLVPNSEHNRVRDLQIEHSRKPYETIGIKSNGEEFPIEVYTKSKIFKGKDLLIVGIRDLSELKNSQQEIQQNAQILNIASRIANMGGWEYNLKNKSLTLTGNLFKVFGVAEGSSFSLIEAFKFYTEDSREVIKKAFSDAVNSGKNFDLELLIHTPVGNLKYIHQVGFTEKISGKVDRVYGMIRDISDMKMMEFEQNQFLEKERKLADLEKLISKSDDAKQLGEGLLQSLSKHIPQCSYFSFFSKSVDVNDAYYSVSSICDSEYVNDLERVFFTEEITGIEKLANGESVVLCDIDKNVKEGEFMSCLLEYNLTSCHMIPLIYNYGELLGFIALGTKKNHDIQTLELDYIYSIRNRIARSFNRHLLAEQVVEKNKLLGFVNKKLQESVNDLQIFSHAISHDMKAPLAGMINLLDWIEEDHGMELSEEAAKKIKLLKNATNKMANSVNGVLSYAKVDQRIKKINLDLNKVIDDVLKMLMIPKNVTVTIPKHTFSIKADIGLLSKLIQNLISNAINYNDKEECLITFEFSEDDKFTQFSITDNGVGIAATHIDKIFDLFQKMGKSKNESSGIGLAIVKKIVTIHRGIISVESEPKVGSTFHVRLPK